MYPVELTCDADYSCKNPEHPRVNGEYGPDYCDLPVDDGTMPGNVNELAKSVVGHRIVSAEKGTRVVDNSGYSWRDTLMGLILTLDNGEQVMLADTGDCCAHTTLESFLLHPDKVDHIITGVGTTDGYTKWHIYADFGDVMELQVEWSCGNPFYYAYGFDIRVIPLTVECEEQKELTGGSAV